jgi:hypothetical protein
MSLYAKVVRSLFPKKETPKDEVTTLHEAVAEYAVKHGPADCAERLARMLVAMVFESKTNHVSFCETIRKSRTNEINERWELFGRGTVDVEVSGQWTQIGTPERKDDSWLL